ncbi:hypothetical protein [Pseudobutyrivibrio xylanivorans]|uniref:Uncharacterized protein n=1 Tax=Pseudobutyrivibrio xylanivorans DSM 14809 TaxID=1123012 RepID=A0A1M6GV40_PSEXY|nr:hypothetical protein [Pseudobutyrivibrio xylanivorans]SHJ13797.1 hypothetical protein SAMN02745725_01833 [Pseudobutyrivibrio xylanivorans DSM 14809]
MLRKKLSDKNKNFRLVVFIGLFLTGLIAVFFYAALTGNDNQVFTDVVMEFTSAQGSNKSAERNMFYIFSIIGVLIYTLCYIKIKENLVSKNEIKSSVYALTTLLVLIGINYLVHQKLSVLLLAGLLIYIVATLKDESLVINALSFYIISIYATCGLYRLYVSAGGNNDIKIIYPTILCMLITLVIVLISSDKKLLLKGILFSQALVPLLLLVFIANKYIENTGSVTTVSIPKRASFFIIVLILLFEIEAIIKIRKNLLSLDSLNSILTYGTCVSIMTFNRFSGSGSIAVFDFHHTYENVIGFSQIFQLGQKPFADYIPVSGMYSVLHGFVFWFFGHGLETYYYLSTNIYFLMIILIIVFLLRKQFAAEWVLLISILFVVEDYNRVALIVPAILLLTWPDLIAKKNLWLKAWLLSSYVHGLYYPVFGAAVCIAFLPLGIWQIYTYVKSGDLLVDIKTTKFWAWWIICFLPILAGTKLLLGTLKHMLAMGKQTIFADGVARFGQVAPDDFFPYISNMSVRVMIYLLLSYMVLITIVWISFALFLKCGDIKFGKNIKNPVAGYISITVAIMFLIAFSYTVVRFDHLELYSRNSGIVKAAFIVFLIIVYRYIPKGDKISIWLLAFSIALLSFASAEGFWKIDSDSKLSANYQVPADYIRVNDTSVHLGDCFIAPDGYEYINHFNDVTSIYDKNRSFLGIVENFGLFYFCDIKGDSVMEITNTIRGYGAAKETIDILKEKHSIVGRYVNSDSNYYLYHWLLTSGEYIWDDNARLFLPNEGMYSKEKVLELNKPTDISWGDLNLEKTPGSWGSSMESLKNIFSEVELGHQIKKLDCNYEVSFENEIDGDEADFIYLDFGDLTANYKYQLFFCDDEITQEPRGIFKYIYKRDYNPDTDVEVSWVDDLGRYQQISCNMDEGKLLIPLGARTGWLLNKHDGISISIYGDDSVISNINLNEIKFLKLREVN